MTPHSPPRDAIWVEDFTLTDDDELQIRECVRYAVLAATAHNAQARQFTIRGSVVEIHPDRTRSTPEADPDERELTMSLGAALENLLIAARHSGFGAAVEAFSDAAPDCVRVTLHRSAPEPSPLFAAIPKRHTNRRAYDGRPIPDQDLQALEAAVEEDGVRVDFLTTPEPIERIVDLVAQGHQIQMVRPAFMDELIGWIRFSRRSIDTHRDGLTSVANGRPQVPDWFGRLLMRHWFTLARQTRVDAGLIRSASAVMVFSSERNDERALVDVGRSLERMLLVQTLLGIRSAHLNQNWQLPELRDGLSRVVDLDGRHPQLVLRLGYAEALPHAPRRPLSAVVTTSSED